MNLDELRLFYDGQAGKFHETRKNFWPEFDEIVNEINNLDWESVKILDLWCGSWRLFKYLQSKVTKQIKYKGVDISKNLLDIAKKENKMWKFVNCDMEWFLTTQEQESYDVVILVASFQHLFTRQKRLFVLKHIYRILKYNWKVIMANWSFSKWFFQKYKDQIINSLLKCVFSLWFYKYNDINIPWKDKKVTYFRYYHIFWLNELKTLMRMSSFVIRKLWFVDNFWGFTQKRAYARNSFVVWEKNVLK